MLPWLEHPHLHHKPFFGYFWMQKKNSHERKYFLKLITDSIEEEFIILIAFFPTEHEYLNHFSPASPDLPKFNVKSLKTTLNGCFN